MRIHSAGRSATLVEFDGLDETMAYYRALAADPPPPVVDLVPAARTVLVTFDGPPGPVLQWISSVQPTVEGTEAGSDTVTIPVVYDGEDLDEVARLTDLSTTEVVAAHLDQTWTVAFGGFAPGFGYLVGTDTRLHVPRRTSPRTSVPVGSVGLAGEFSGIYPRSSPGGWQLIGRTDAQLWNLDRDPPALLRPGITVRFEQA
ncbi:5-oxoprolinase subunit PxpB [Rhodococcoides fascians]|uniref:5-oxoprolinase subunit PxpB n=1 Tax=Rhodococcoides fascians TaxID=1828 RepID=UPI00050C8A1A|nr:5-oxoprolinase subunit PxpB [Rhodococcus fascians]